MTKRAKYDIKIIFGDSDLEGIVFSHDDALVIMSVIDNSQVKQVMVDNGALVDILFHQAFKRGYNDSQLIPSNMLLYGFNGVESKVEGTIQLHVPLP